MNKILVIGLDGATWKIIIPMIEKGKMPNLNNLMQKGASGILQSTIPPITPAAWTSFQTGVNPGKHGIIDFRFFDRDVNKIDLVNSSNINMRTLWEIASLHNKKTILINVPLTFPPRAINGIVIGDMLSPAVDERFVYPRAIYDQYIKGQGYQITGGRIDKYKLKSLENFVHEQVKVEEKRFNLAKKLINEQEWDLFMIHNQMMDRIQHAFYSYLDPTSKSYNDDKFDKISIFYEQTDNFIGELVKNAGDNTTVIILSDHGSLEVKSYVNLNIWLYNKGYLNFTYKQYLGNLFTFAKSIGIFDIMKKITCRMVKKPMLFAELTGKASKNLIDLKKSKAYSINSSIWGNMYCVDKKIISRIIKDLRNFRDPEDKNNIVKKVYLKEEIFKGPYLDHLPDLFLEPEKGYIFFTPLIKNMHLFQRPALSRYERVGSHDTDGVIVIKGKNINNITDINGNIFDLMPTILHILDLPVPSYIDGRVLEDIFVKKIPVKITNEDLCLKASKPQGYCDSDKAVIEKRLKELGYL
jgi:predicted AlkP superfamily phosphohydrolase/phosphomutase